MKRSDSSPSRTLNIRSLSEVNSSNRNSSKKLAKSPSVENGRSAQKSPKKLPVLRKHSSDSFSTQQMDASLRTPTRSPNSRSPSSKTLSRTESSGDRKRPSTTPRKNLTTQLSAEMSARSSRSYSSSSESSFDDNESQTFTEAQFGVTTNTSRGSFTEDDDDDDSLFSHFSQDSFSIYEDDLDTSQYVSYKPLLY